MPALGIYVNKIGAGNGPPGTGINVIDGTALGIGIIVKDGTALGLGVRVNVVSPGTPGGIYVRFS